MCINNLFKSYSEMWSVLWWNFVSAMVKCGACYGVLCIAIWWNVEGATVKCVQKMHILVKYRDYLIRESCFIYANNLLMWYTCLSHYTSILDHSGCCESRLHIQGQICVIGGHVKSSLANSPRRALYSAVLLTRPTFRLLSGRKTERSVWSKPMSS